MDSKKDTSAGGAVSTKDQMMFKDVYSCFLGNFMVILRVLGMFFNVFGAFLLITGHARMQMT